MRRQLTLALLKAGLPWEVARTMPEEEALLWVEDWVELNTPPVARGKKSKIRRRPNPRK